MAEHRLARAAVLLALAAGAAAPGSTRAAVATAPWPPAGGPGTLFAHYGEEHLNDADGARILPRVVEETIRYRPALVIPSADKSNDGTIDQLTAWRQAMAPYAAAGIPVFPATGNHDRKAPPGAPGGVSPVADLTNYTQVFAGWPYPFGDAPPPAIEGFAPSVRPASDPTGASSHYSFDLGRTRWIVLDNSCLSLINCDPLQSPPFPDAQGNRGQYEFLAREAAAAKAAGRTVLVAFHVPTQDPRPGHSQPTPSAHNMGEGTSPDNASFEQAAADARVDGVFAAHVKGQWIYRARGVPYFTDGGAGGALYVGSGEKVGVDSGYWHGYRLVRVLPDGQLVTDAVPVLVPDGITVQGPERVAVEETATLRATGRQPTQKGPMVDALELRSPDRSRPNFANLPDPARVWTSADAEVLSPLRAPADDPRGDAGTQNQSGRFHARCPGRTSVSITSGWETAAASVLVTSRPGRIVSSIAARSRVLRRGRPTKLVAVRLAQPARVRVRVLRGRRAVATLFDACRGRSPLGARWTGRGAPRGGYVIEVRVSSDRAPVIRRFGVRVR